MLQSSGGICGFPSDLRKFLSVGEAGVLVVVVGKIQAELLIGEAPADVSIGEATKESSKFCPSCTGAYMKYLPVAPVGSGGGKFRQGSAVNVIIFTCII